MRTRGSKASLRLAGTAMAGVALLFASTTAVDAQPRERLGERATAGKGERPRVRLGRVVPTSDCRGSSYDVVVSPDGTSVSVLFDNFVVNGGEGERAESCSLSIPLNLPEGYSLGVYQVDYRGYANLGPRQAGLLAVDYAVGDRGNSRRFRHRLTGPQDGDFTFTERMRPGMLRRIGCGPQAKLDLTATLMFRRGEANSESVLALDSMDGTRSPAGVTFAIDLQPCRANPPRG